MELHLYSFALAKLVEGNIHHIQSDSIYNASETILRTFCHSLQHHLSIIHDDVTNNTQNHFSVAVHQRFPKRFLTIEKCGTFQQTIITR